MGAVESTRKRIESGHQFSCEFYKQLVKLHPKGNLFFSPLGVASAIALIAEGSRGQTKEQLLDAIGQNDLQKLHSVFKNILEAIVYDNKKNTTAIENVLFLHKRYHVKDTFTKITKSYRSSIERIDFSADHQQVLQQLKEWLVRVTNRRVTTDLGIQIDRETVLVVADFVYHKSLWAIKFNPANTKTGDFHVDGNRTIPVNFMSQRGRFRIIFDESLQCYILVLPYNDKRTMMLLMVPKKIDGLARIETMPTQKYLEDTISKMREKREIKIVLPKFELEETFNLVPILESMGVRNLFVKRRADLQDLCEDADLHVNQFTHKGILKVTEDGSEVETFGKDSRDSLPIVKADHPFLFLIFDKTTQTVLFMGRLVEPSPV